MTPLNLPYRFEKLTHRKTGYPVASVAYYGEDDQFASKAVVGIILKENNDVDFMKKWFATGTDVRQDPDINSEIVRFVEQHNVHRVAMVDRIIGCPHEEGIDYPDGEACPQCPFWANRDRFTGMIIDRFLP